MEQKSTILISNLRQHKPAAWQQLLTEHGPMVFRMVQRIVTRREDAEEVYQDVFVKALRGIEAIILIRHRSPHGSTASPTTSRSTLSEARSPPYYI